jgi:hypothetical protein
MSTQINILICSIIVVWIPFFLVWYELSQIKSHSDPDLKKIELLAFNRRLGGLCAGLLSLLAYWNYSVNLSAATQAVADHQAAMARADKTHREAMDRAELNHREAMKAAAETQQLVIEAAVKGAIKDSQAKISKLERDIDVARLEQRYAGVGSPIDQVEGARANRLEMMAAEDRLESAKLMQNAEVRDPILSAAYSSVVDTFDAWKKGLRDRSVLFQESPDEMPGIFVRTGLSSASVVTRNIIFPGRGSISIKFDPLIVDGGSVVQHFAVYLVVQVTDLTVAPVTLKLAQANATDIGFAFGEDEKLSDLYRKFATPWDSASFSSRRENPSWKQRYQTVLDGYMTFALDHLQVPVSVK